MQVFEHGTAHFYGPDFDIEDVAAVYQWNNDGLAISVEIYSATFAETVDRDFLVKLFGETVVKATEAALAEQLEEELPARELGARANAWDETCAMAAE